MKNIRLILVLVLVLTAGLAHAQENTVKIKLSGFVAAETYFDSRTTVNSRGGAILLYPTNVLSDAQGNDLNDRSEFFMTSIQSRLNVAVSGFEAFGAKGTAAIEGDFVGTGESSTGLFRLRHAYIKLDWQKDQLIAGKFWHPLFVGSASPQVLHWGAALPFGVLNRAPQLRYTHKLSDNTSFNIAILSDMDFNSKGPNDNSAKYAQQSGVPEFTAQVKTNFTKAIEVGATLGYRTIMPLTVNSAGLKTDNTLSSYYMNSWISLSSSKMKWNLQGIYGQNMSNFFLIGGYAVKSVNANGDYEYTNLSTMSITSDLYTTTGDIRYGLNLGYSKNLGAEDDLYTNASGAKMIYNLGKDIDYLYQVAPRIEFLSGNMKIGGEIIYTAAAYGDTQISGLVENTNIVNSTRLLLHLKYSF